MRISPNILVQKYDNYTPEGMVVIRDEDTGEEIEISEEVAARLLPAMQYFFPALFVDIAPLDTEVPT